MNPGKDCFFFCRSCLCLVFNRFFCIFGFPQDDKSDSDNDSSSDSKSGSSSGSDSDSGSASSSSSASQQSNGSHRSRSSACRAAEAGAGSPQPPPIPTKEQSNPFINSATAAVTAGPPHSSLHATINHSSQENNVSVDSVASTQAPNVVDEDLPNNNVSKSTNSSSSSSEDSSDDDDDDDGEEAGQNNSEGGQQRDEYNTSTKSSPDVRIFRDICYFFV